MLRNKRYQVKQRLVILPGLNGTHELLDGFRTELTARSAASDVISYPVDQALGYNELEEWVFCKLPSEPYVLLGESFAGPLAVKVASKHPLNMVGLILSTSFSHSPIPAARFLAPLLAFWPDPPIGLLSHILLGRWRTQDAKENLSKAIKSIKPNVLRHRAREAMQVDVSDCLPAISIPVLCLVASADRLILPAKQRTLATQFNSAKTAEIVGPHFLLQTRPGAAADHVVRFMAGLGV